MKESVCVPSFKSKQMMIKKPKTKTVIMKAKNLLLCMQIVLLSVLVSCGQKEGQIPISKTWDCAESDMKSTFDIQSLFSDRYILALEETEQSRIGSVAKVVMSDSLIFVLDNRLAMRAFVFNKNTGKYINSIGCTGKGPGEYVDINDFSVDLQAGTVSLLCGRKRVCVYDYAGKFKYQKELSFYADKIECKDGKYYFCCYDYGRGNLIITDGDMHELASYFVNKPDVPVVIQTHPLQKLSDGTIVFFRFLDANIYTVDENNELSVHCQIDFGSDRLDYSKLTKENWGETVKVSRCDLVYYTENDKYAWIMFYDHDDAHESILDKSTGKILAFPADHMTDSALGNYESIVEYGYRGSMAMILDGENIKDELVRNKDCNRGSNPGVYFLINK